MSNWIIPVLGRDVVFKSEDQAFEFLGELWARISELVLENYKGKEHDEYWLSNLEPDTLGWTKSKKDILAKQLYLLFDEYLADNDWSKEDMLSFIKLLGSKKPDEYWSDLAFNNDGSFFVWPAKIYKEEDRQPAYPKMVPVEVSKKLLTKSGWYIPVLGGDIVFKSEDQAFEFLGELWARISELVLENYKGKEHDEYWLSNLEPDTLGWTKSKKDILAKRIYLLFDEYLADNDWSKKDMLSFIKLLGSKKPRKYWSDLAFGNDGSFFVWPSKIYKQEDRQPAYPEMVPVEIPAKSSPTKSSPAKSSPAKSSPVKPSLVKPTLTTKKVKKSSGKKTMSKKDKYNCDVHTTKTGKTSCYLRPGKASNKCYRSKETGRCRLSSGKHKL